ncbi:hypothetical protein, partial [Hydrogeniiclostridium mannosilyticum]|uniref:hypothetical protein n=1 Tax=Hydrogeniiclostridium mannosilyticum TaxID=2764322 RepID=UPI001C0A6900
LTASRKALDYNTKSFPFCQPLFFPFLKKLFKELTRCGFSPISPGHSGIWLSPLLWKGYCYFIPF